MLRINNLRTGDIISVNNDGIIQEGSIVGISHEQNQVQVDNGVQEFWYAPDELDSIPLDDIQLMNLGFTKEEIDGGVKYKKDSFRLITPRKGDFSNIEMWYREDRRHFSFPLGVHELQNLHHDMTKIHLEKPVHS
ncbi:MAG: hypothetical protein JJE22_02860 [Bacteroidia bacterium]|nr:hypothetical protein [Bacteroidia bacterium]